MKKAILLLLIGVSFLGFANFALAEIIILPNPLCPQGLIPAGQLNAGAPVNPNNCITGVVQLVIVITNFIFGIIGALAVLMFVWAGILFVTTGANPGNVDHAKHVLIYAIIGLAIALGGTGLVAVVTAVIGGAPPTGGGGGFISYRSLLLGTNL